MVKDFAARFGGKQAKTRAMQPLGVRANIFLETQNKDGRVCLITKGVL